MPIDESDSPARRAAITLVERYDKTALQIAERAVDHRLAADDVQGALEMDQVRREVAFMLRS